MSLNLSDLDNNSSETPSVGLFGGFISEIVLYVATLKRLATKDERFIGLKDYLSSTENVINIFKEVLNFVLQTGSFDVAINESCEA